MSHQSSISAYTVFEMFAITSSDIPQAYDQNMLVYPALKRLQIVACMVFNAFRGPLLFCRNSVMS